MTAHSGRTKQNFWSRYIFSTDHKVIGIQFLIFSLFMFLIGGLLAMLMRWQLAYPGKPLPLLGPIFPDSMMVGGIMLPEFYNMLFTMHASVMIFFAIIPILVGAFANYLIPLQIGAQDMAFPKNQHGFILADAARGPDRAFRIFSGRRRGQDRMDRIPAAERL